MKKALKIIITISVYQSFLCGQILEHKKVFNSSVNSDTLYTVYTDSIQLFFPRQIIPYDINADNNMDLIASYYSPSNQRFVIGIITKNEHGKYSIVNEIEIGSSVSRFTIDDFDNDGKADVVVLSDTLYLSEPHGSVDILKNNGNFNFSVATTPVDTWFIFLEDVASFDYDNDDKIDIIIATDNGFIKLHNEGNLNFTYETFNWYEAFSKLSSIDFNLDGHIDYGALFGFQYDSFKLPHIVLFQNNSGTFEAIDTIKISDDPYNNGEYFQFNHLVSDTSYDLIITTPLSKKISLYKFDQNIYPRLISNINGDVYSEAVFEDFDADGQKDVAYISKSNRKILKIGLLDTNYTLADSIIINFDVELTYVVTEESNNNRISELIIFTGASQTSNQVYSDIYTINFEDQSVSVINDSRDQRPYWSNLTQNYPNPFNPITTISYQLSKKSLVDLSIFNLVGEKVVTLVSEEQPVGKYEVEWNAQAYSSGIYIYKLKTQFFEQSRKMILLQ